MKRQLCTFTVVYAIFSLLSLTVGNEFCRFSLMALIPILLVGIFFRLVLKNKAFTAVITASLFAIVAVSITMIVHLPRLENAKMLDNRYVEAEGKIISASASDAYTSFTVKCKAVGDTDYSQKITVIVRNNTVLDADVGRYIKFSGILNYDDSVYNKGKESFLTVFPSYCETIETSDPFGEFVYLLRQKVKDISADMHHSELINALLIGDKSNISDDVTEDFKRIGTSHLLAISGLHLSIVVMSFYKLVTRLGLPHLFAAFLSLCLSFVYLSVTGFSLSLVRAGEMMAVFFLSKSIRRQNDSITSLFAAGLFILLTSPWSIFNVGFLLSFVATFGILVFVPPLAEARRKRFIDNQDAGVVFTKKRTIVHKLVGVFLSSVFTTLSATVTTIPIIVSTFNEISVFVLIGNIFTIAVAKYFLMFSVLAVFFSAVGFTFMFQSFSFLSSVAGTVLISTTDFLSSISPNLISLNYTYLTFGVLILTAIVIIFISLSKHVWSLPCLVLIITVFIPVFNLASSNIVYSTALIDSVSKSGANTAMLRWKDQVYILDQTSSDSQRFYSLIDIADKNGVAHIDNAVFISNENVPVRRISALLTLFDVETVTVVSAVSDIDSYAEAEILCQSYDTKYDYVFSETYHVADGVTAYCYKDVCSAFVIENGEESFCSYRSYNSVYYIPWLLEADYLEFYGKELPVVVNSSSASSFRLAT